MPFKNTPYHAQDLVAFLAKYLKKSKVEAEQEIASRGDLNVTHFRLHNTVIAKDGDIYSFKLEGVDFMGSPRKVLVGRFFRPGQVVAIGMPDPEGRKQKPSKMDRAQTFKDIMNALHPVSE